MKQNEKVNVLFWLFRARGNEFGAPLRCRVSIEKQRYEISLNYTVPFKIWAADAQRCKQSNALGREVNAAIDRLQEEINTAIEMMRKEEIPLTVENLKLKLTAKDNLSYHSLLSLFDYHKVVDRNNITASTMKLYDVTRNHVVKFMRIKYRLADIDIRKVRKDFATEFFAYLQGWKRDESEPICQNNAAIKHMQRVSHLFNMAFENEWIDKNVLATFRMHTRSKDRGFLTEEEICRIQTLTDCTPAEEITRDMFLFSVYTGICYIDIGRLTDENISVGMDGKRWITFNRLKTGNRCMVPLLQPSEEVLAKYRQAADYLPGHPLLPIATNQQCNRDLKRIAAKAGIRKAVTFHLARHTFATTVTLSNDIPIETVSSMMGHASISTTQIYAKVVGKKISRDTEALRKLYESKEALTHNKVSNQ